MFNKFTQLIVQIMIVAIQCNQLRRKRDEGGAEDKN